jgi:Flp pilus assembly pilin Flp
VTRRDVPFEENDDSRTIEGETPMKNEMQKRNMNALVNETEGLSTVEYVILLVLIAVVGITAWKTFGSTIVNRVNGGQSTIQGM